MAPTETKHAGGGTEGNDRIERMRGEIAELRELVQQVLTRADRAQEKIAAIRAGRGKKQQQTESVMVRFTPAEMKRVERAAKRAGQKNAGFVRIAALEAVHGPEIAEEDRKIRALRAEAGAAGDMKQVAVCDNALAGAPTARAACLEVIADAAAMVE